jgi:hypothetical protein
MNKDRVIECVTKHVARKDATIVNTGADDDFPGTFEVVLSTPAKDRDGDELAIEDWKQPLPDHITFDTDHGMSVASTVGSGTPTIEDGKLIVRGAYSSLPRAQEARTLVNEKHIRTVSVAFMSAKVTKDGKSRTQRELLNGAFVAIPSNREAVVLSAKSGARNSASDQVHIQAIYEHAMALGAGPMDDTGAETGAVGGKGLTVKGKYTAEQERQMLSDGHALKDDNGNPSYPIGDKADLDDAIRAVGRGGADHDSIRAYIIRRAKELGASDAIPANWNADGSLAAKSYSGKPGHDPAALAQGVDAALDEALALLVGVDQSTLPEPVAQALGLLNAAAMGIDELLDVMGVDDPDDDDEEEDAATGNAAPSGDAAKTVDADVLALKYRALSMLAAPAAV